MYIVMWINYSKSTAFLYTYRFKLCGDDDINRLHEDVSILKRWPLTPGYILRPDGIPLSEAATEQVYEIFNGITSEAENFAKNHDPRQVLLGILRVRIMFKKFHIHTSYGILTLKLKKKLNFKYGGFTITT